MPVSYGFHDAKTDKAVSLSVIDDEIRKAFGLPPCEDKYSDHFHAIVDCGIAVCGSGHFDAKKLKPVADTDVSGLKTRAILLRFLKGEYEFWCYRYY